VKLNKEVLFQLVLVLLFYLDSIIEISYDGILISDTPVINFLFLAYHCILFLIVNYLLIPKYFNNKKYLQFFLWIILLIVIFGIIEEGIVEKILDPNHKGSNEVTWQSIYWYFGEIIVPLLAFVSVKFMFDNFNQQHEMEKIKQDNLTNELKFLKSQVQPHILFNSLNNVYNFALKKSDQVPDLILKLSNVLRYVLYEASEEKVTLLKELNFIKDYVDLQDIQYKGRGIISLEIDNEIENNSLYIAPFIFIPFVENCFKHSFGTITENIEIQIKLVVKKEYILLTTINNYDENYEANSHLIVGGIGLTNITKRLKLLYPQQYELKTWTENHFFFVELKILLTQ